MHVAVLGAGVVGITSAHYLIKAGHTVTVIDGEDSVAAGCSHANGSQLSYSYTDAMASPAFLLKMPKILAGLDQGVRVRAPLSTDLLRWGLGFLAQCTNQKAAANTLATLAMAQRSKVLLAELRDELEGDFAYRSAGKLVMLRSQADVDNAKRVCALKREHGCEVEVVDIAQTHDIEPAIEHMTEPYVGAVYSPGDDVGDARAFSAALASQLGASGHLQLQLGTEVLGLIGDRRKVRGVKTTVGDIAADALVVSLGAHSPSVLKPLGIRPRILPARGYSITLPTGPQSNTVSITDPASRFVIGRNNGSMRIAGFADFIGFKRIDDSRRIEQLTALAKQRAPLAADYDAAANQAWGGFRPLTPDGRPLIGATPVDGLYLNTGHGSLGWTLACASGEALANSIAPAAQTRPAQPDAPGLSAGLQSSYTR